MQLCEAQCRVSLHDRIQLVAFYSLECNRARVFVADIGLQSQKQRPFYDDELYVDGENHCATGIKKTLIFRHILHKNKSTNFTVDTVEFFVES